jgi:hypothetical protein
VKLIGRLTLLLLAGGPLGCATARPAQDVVPLLGEARQNEVAAYAKYHKDDIGVKGVVLETGLDQFSQTVASGFGWAPGWGSVTAHQEQVIYPYVVIGAGVGQARDVVKCYFGQDESETVGGIARGEPITVQGRFHQYVHLGEALMLVLGGCRIE